MLDSYLPGLLVTAIKKLSKFDLYMVNLLIILIDASSHDMLVAWTV